MTNVVEFDYLVMDDAELIRLLQQRKLPIPTMNGGFVNKTDAARALKKWDKSRSQNEERVWVTFHQSAHPSAGPYVFASINDKTIQCPFDTKVCIPRYFLTECIDRAINVTYYQKEIPGQGFKRLDNRIPTYTYTIHGIATEDEAKQAISTAARRGRPKKKVGVSDNES